MNLFYNIALVGRPNVGKSRLFNRLARRKISIVHDMPGVTRDIITHDMGNNVILMDTGGLGLSGANSVKEITSAVDKQVFVAVAAADLVLFVVDATEGIMPLDHDIADMLRKANKDVIILANKIDSEKKLFLADEFARFGFGIPVAVSGEHGVGEDKLRKIISKKTGSFVMQIVADERDSLPIKVTFVGRPNVGKSSLINALLKRPRMIVSDVPGTTREAVSVILPSCSECGHERDFELLDTAGLRAASKATSSLDYFSSLRRHAGIVNCDVIFLVIDATTGVTKLDKKIANEAIDSGRGVIVVVNKWDIAQKGVRSGDVENFDDIKAFQSSFCDAVRGELMALPGVEIVFVSAVSGYGIGGLLTAAEKLFNRQRMKLGTGRLNHVIQEALVRHPPSTKSGRRFRIYYATQVGNMPFTFKVFCNRKALLSDNYQKYLINTLRSNFDLSGCSIRLAFSEKESRQH